MTHSCRLCKRGEKDAELRGVLMRGKKYGLWCKDCFEIGSPGRAYLKWENAMLLRDYEMHNDNNLG